jgi:hypothetical protein
MVSLDRRGPTGAVHGINADRPDHGLIEMFGLPGSGKSTLVNTIMAEPSGLGPSLAQPEPLRYRGRPRLGRLGYQIGQHHRLRRLALAAYRLAWHGGPAGRASARVVPSLLVDTARLSHASGQLLPGQTCIFKQGPLQQLRAVVARAPMASDRDLERILAELQAAIQPPAQWTVVHLETSADTASTRVGQRPGNLGQYDRMAPEARQAALRAELEAQQRIVAALVRLDLARVVHLDGELDRHAVMAMVPSIPGGGAEN